MMGLIAAALIAPPPPAESKLLRDWRIEAEDPNARVTEQAGVIDIDTRKGLTLWSMTPVASPVTIRFEAMAVAEGGANDTASDLNAFWMATETGRGGGPRRPRHGAFGAYDELRTYYVGIGGNRNTTTRFRRYVGIPGKRPILPEHDKRAPADLLVANRWTRIALIANGHTVAVERDGVRLFTLHDPQPYSRGYWGLRTTWSHLRIRRVRVSAR